MEFKQFNEYVDTFLDSMQKTFPNEKKIGVYILKFQALKTLDYKKPAELMMEHMIPYAEQILKKDEQHFKDSNEFSQSVQSISGEIGLSRHWIGLSDEVKLSIWEYLQGILILGMNVLGYTKELRLLLQATGFKSL